MYCKFIVYSYPSKTFLFENNIVVKSFSIQYIFQIIKNILIKNRIFNHNELIILIETIEYIYQCHYIIDQKKVTVKTNQKYFGIKNIGNSCYANSMIQVLHHCFKDICSVSKNNILREVMNQNIDHTSIFKLIKSISFNNNQHDPSEFLFEILKFDDTKEYPWIIKSTLGYKKNKLIHLQKHVSITNEFIHYIPYDIVIDLENFSYHKIIENIHVKLDEYPDVTDNTIRELQILPNKNSETFMICLQIFKWNINSLEKLKCRTIVPLTTFIFRGILVKIKAIIFHEGNDANYGHYFVWIRDRNTFVKIDDNHISYLNFDNKKRIVFSSKNRYNPYIIVIEKVKK